MKIHVALGCLDVLCVCVFELDGLNFLMMSVVY